MDISDSPAFQRLRSGGPPVARRAVTPRAMSTDFEQEEGQPSSLPIRYVNVMFEVEANTGFGEAIYLALDVPELGGEHVPLLTSPELHPIHRIERPIALRAGTVADYKYARYCAGRFEKWEDRPARKLSLIGAEKEYLVHDTLDEAFSTKHLTHHSSQSSVSSAGTSTPPVASMASPKQTLPRLAKAQQQKIALSAAEGVLVVSFYLPCRISRVRRGVWNVEVDENALIYRQPDPNSMSILDRMRARYVGVPPSDDHIPVEERVHVTRALARYGCIPVFLNKETETKSLQYCEGTLRNVFYGFVDVYGRLPTKWWNPNLQNSNWFAYIEAGKSFVEVIQGNYDDRTMVWIHGYELIPVLPQLARKLHATVRRVGLSIHRPFPSSEIFRTLSVRVDLLRAMLSADVITFHLFEYVRHFATCARRILGLEEERIFPGHVELNVDGRSVLIVPIHGGVDVPHVMRYLNTKSLCAEAREMIEEFRRGRVLIVGLDYGGQMDGIKTKLLAFEQLLEQRPELATKVCFVQKVIRGRWGGPGGGGVAPAVIEPDSKLFDYSGLMDETDAEDELDPVTNEKSPWAEPKCRAIAERINSKYGQLGSPPIVYLEVLDQVPKVSQRLVLFAAGDILFQTPLREGVSLFPFEFCLASAQTHGFYHAAQDLDVSSTEGESDGGEDDDESRSRGDLSSSVMGQSTDDGPSVDHDETLRKLPPQPVPVMVLSEFSSHVSLLSGAIRVNPWRVSTVLKGLEQALDMGLEERISRFQADLETVRYRTATRWAEHVLTKIKEATSSKVVKRAEPDIVVGMGLNIRLIRADKVAAKLPLNQVVKHFSQAKRRLLMLDYGGTTVLDDVGASFQFRPRGGVLYPTQEMTEALQKLCVNEDTDVFIVSGRQREEIQQAFVGAGKRIGLVAEHGFYTRLPGETEWHHLYDDMEIRDWMDTAVNLMQVYTMRTNGTYVEKKESMVLWQYRDADPDFGARQAQELQLHLQFVLTPFDVDVVKGKGYVEVRTAGCDKGRAAKELFEMKRGQYDFVLAIGDDNADEPMFEFFNTLAEHQPQLKVFTCAVGVQSRSSAEYHVDEVSNVLEVLQGLQNAIGYRQVGSVLHLAGIEDVSEDEENDDDYFDQHAPMPMHVLSNFGQIRGMRISQSVPAGFGIEEALSDGERDDVNFFSAPGHRGAVRDDRPPSF